jgi:plastocyanin/uncharacterized membrane protein YozB (DUF420 family)
MYLPLGMSTLVKTNVNFAIEILMGLALLAGMILARRKMFRAHAACQASVVLLNLVPILTFMVPSFRASVWGQIPASLGDPYYSVATAHAALGATAELLGLYVLLVAGTNFVPEALRFRNYKPWMRATLLLWWLVIGLGAGTYLVWYVGTRVEPAQTQTVSPSPVASTSKPTPPTVTVTMGNFTFEPKEVAVSPGTTVIFKNAKGKHSVFADDGSFSSQIMAPGEEFRHTFESPGRVQYYCSLHGAAGGKDMAGTVIVK